MDQADGVSLVQRIARLFEQVNRPSWRHRPIALDKIPYAQARKVFHDIIKRAVAGAAEVEDFDRVPVRQRGRGPNLALETRQRLGIGRVAGPNQLDRAAAPQQLVLGQIHFAHPARANPMPQFVLAELPGFEYLASQPADGVRAIDGGSIQHGHGEREVEEMIGRE